MSNVEYVWNEDLNRFTDKNTMKVLHAVSAVYGAGATKFVLDETVDLYFQQPSKKKTRPVLLPDGTLSTHFRIFNRHFDAEAGRYVCRGEPKVSYQVGGGFRIAGKSATITAVAKLLKFPMVDRSLGPEISQYPSNALPHLGTAAAPAPATYSQAAQAAAATNGTSTTGGLLGWIGNKFSSILQHKVVEPSQRALDLRQCLLSLASAQPGDTEAVVRVHAAHTHALRIAQIARFDQLQVDVMQWLDGLRGAFQLLGGKAERIQEADWAERTWFMLVVWSLSHIWCTTVAHRALSSFGASGLHAAWGQLAKAANETCKQITESAAQQTSRSAVADDQPHTQTLMQVRGFFFESPATAQLACNFSGRMAFPTSLAERGIADQLGLLHNGQLRLSVMALHAITRQHLHHPGAGSGSLDTGPHSDYDNILGERHDSFLQQAETSEGWQSLLKPDGHIEAALETILQLCALFGWQPPVQHMVAAVDRRLSRMLMTRQFDIMQAVSLSRVALPFLLRIERLLFRAAGAQAHAVTETLVQMTEKFVHNVPKRLSQKHVRDILSEFLPALGGWLRAYSLASHAAPTLGAAAVEGEHTSVESMPPASLDWQTVGQRLIHAALTILHHASAHVDLEPILALCHEWLSTDTIPDSEVEAQAGVVAVWFSALGEKLMQEPKFLQATSCSMIRSVLDSVADLRSRQDLGLNWLHSHATRCNFTRGPVRDQINQQTELVQLLSAMSQWNDLASAGSRTLPQQVQMLFPLLLGVNGNGRQFESAEVLKLFFTTALRFAAERLTGGAASADLHQLQEADYAFSTGAALNSEEMKQVLAKLVQQDNFGLTHTTHDALHEMEQEHVRVHRKLPPLYLIVCSIFADALRVQLHSSDERDPKKAARTAVHMVRTQLRCRGSGWHVLRGSVPLNAASVFLGAAMVKRIRHLEQMGALGDIHGAGDLAELVHTLQDQETSGGLSEHLALYPYGNGLFPPQLGDKPLLMLVEHELGQLLQTITNKVARIQEGHVTKQELEQLKCDTKLPGVIRLLAAGLEVQEVLKEADVRWRQAQHEYGQLDSVVVKLQAMGAEIDPDAAVADEDSLRSTTEDLEEKNADRLCALGLEDDAIKALKHFCGRGSDSSDLFAHSFRTEHIRLCANGEDATSAVNQATATAVEQLKGIIKSSEDKISSLVNENIQDTIERTQLRAGAILNRELAMVSSFFSEGSGETSEQRANLLNLKAAADLLRFREHAEAAIIAVNQFGFLSGGGAAVFEAALGEVRAGSDPKLKECPAIVNRMSSALKGVRAADLSVLAAFQELNPFLTYLVANAANIQDQFEFAQRASATNPHLQNVLYRLPPLLQLAEELLGLQQAVEPGAFGGGAAARKLTSTTSSSPHPAADGAAEVQKLLALVRQAVDSSAEEAGLDVGAINTASSSPLSGELKSLASNWQHVEAALTAIHSRDSAATANVAMIIDDLLQTGQFLSALDVTKRDSGLMLRYRSAVGNKKYVLEAAQVAEHIVGAEMNTTADGNTEHEKLKSFLQAHELATQSHKLRMRLQRAGHPEHQESEEFPLVPLHATLESEPEGKTLHGLADIYLRRLAVEYEEWEAGKAQAFELCPHLAALHRGLTLGFIRALTDCVSMSKENRTASLQLSICPYIVLCLAGVGMQQTARAVALAASQQQLSELDATHMKPAAALQLAAQVVNAAVTNTECMMDDEVGIEVVLLKGASAAHVFAKVAEANANGAGILPHTAQIFQCVSDTSQDDIERLMLCCSGPTRVLPCLFILNPERLSPHVRDILARRLKSCTLNTHVTLVFCRETGIFQFGTPDSSTTWHDPISSDAKKAVQGMCFALQSNGAKPLLQQAVQCIAGAAGSGKSHQARRALVGCDRICHIPVHEGFRAGSIVQMYQAHLDGGASSLGLHIDVSEAADLYVLSSFLYDLIVFGIVKDTASGLACSVSPDVSLSVAVELPALVATEMPARAAWPADASSFSVSSHPMLSSVASLALLPLVHVRAIAVRSELDMTPDLRMAAVGLGLLSAARWADQLACPELQAGWQHIRTDHDLPDLDALCAIGDDKLRIALRVGIDRLEATAPLRVHAGASGLVSQASIAEFVVHFAARVRYCREIFQAIEEGGGQLHSDGEYTLPQLMWQFNFPPSQRQQAQALLAQVGAGSNNIPDFGVFLLQVMALECSQIVSASLDDDFRIHTVRPSVSAIEGQPNPRNQFLIVIAHGQRTDGSAAPFPRKLFALATDHAIFRRIDECANPNDQTYSLPSVRADVAPGLGFYRTDRMGPILYSHNFVLSSLFLSRLLRLHDVHAAKQSLILSGDTGVGKSFLLKLYSALQNGNENVQCNMVELVVSILRSFAGDRLFRARCNLAKTSTTPEEQAQELENISALRFLAVIPEADYIESAVADVVEVKNLPPLPKSADAQKLQFLIDWSTNERHLQTAVVSLGRIGGAAMCSDLATCLHYALFEAVNQFPLHFPNLSEACAADMVQCLRWGSSNSDQNALVQKTLRSSRGTYLNFNEFACLPTSLMGADMLPADIKSAAAIGDKGAGVMTWEDQGIGRRAELYQQLLQAAAQNKALRAEVACPITAAAQLNTLLQQIFDCKPPKLYHRMLMHGGVTAQVWRGCMNKIVRNIESIQQRLTERCGAGKEPSFTMCVFVDELNTADALGMVTEAFSNHSMDGQPLPDNIFFVGAINPKASKAEIEARAAGVVDHTILSVDSAGAAAGALKQPDLEHAAAAAEHIETEPFVVKYLHAPLVRATKAAPPLNEYADEDFLANFVLHTADCRLPQAASIGVPPKAAEALLEAFKHLMVATISAAHRLVDGYRLARVHVSNRDLVRCVELTLWLLDPHGSNSAAGSVNPFLPRDLDAGLDGIVRLRQRLWSALQVSVAVCYWLRLPGKGRHSDTGAQAPDMRKAFSAAMDNLLVSFEGQFGAHRKIAVWWKHDLEYHRLWRFGEYMSRALGHLFEHIYEKPTGLAKTSSLLENLFCVALAINVRPSMSVLVTGPPGCGKTLAVSIIEKNFTGKSAKSPALRNFAHMQTINYQCSEVTTAAEIEELYAAAEARQRLADRPGNIERLVVVIDEAGLPKERQQALKALHDVLEKRGGVATILLSNKVLDAAKTNRCIHVRQTRATADDTYKLCASLLMSKSVFDCAFEGAQCKPDDRVIQARCENLVRGIRDAFQQEASCKRHVEWFHQRDLIYFCRQLRHELGSHRLQQLTPAMLLRCIQRNLQVIPREAGDVTEFRTLCQTFMEKCDFEVVICTPENCQLQISEAELQPASLQSLQLSIEDASDGSPSEAHFRHTMVVDRSNSEAGVSLMFDQGLLKQETTTVVSLSDFPDDQSIARVAQALRGVKRAAELGHTLLLVNCPQSVFTALYDVFNRYYRSVTSQDNTVYYADITIGALSLPVRIHPDFKVVVHISMRQLSAMPTPLLNRFSKFAVSATDALQERLVRAESSPPQCLAGLAKVPKAVRVFFDAISGGVEHFAQTVSSGHPERMFHGFVSKETIPALVLRLMQDSVSAPHFSVRRPVRCHDSEYEPDFDTDTMSKATEGDSTAAERFTSNTQARELFSKLEHFIHMCNFQLLQMAKPEVFVLQNKHAVFPKSYVEEYLARQEHFSGSHCLSSLLIDGHSVWEAGMHSGWSSSPRPSHFVVHTRHSAGVSQLVEAGEAAQSMLQCEVHELQANADLQQWPKPARIFDFGGSASGGDRAQSAQVVAARHTFVLSLSACSSSHVLSTCIAGFYRHALREAKRSFHGIGRKQDDASASTDGESGNSMHEDVLPLPSLVVCANMDTCSASRVNVVRQAIDEGAAAFVAGFASESDTSVEVRISKPVAVVVLHAPPQEARLGADYDFVPLSSDWDAVYVDSIETVQGGDAELNARREADARKWLQSAAGQQDALTFDEVYAELQPLFNSTLQEAAGKLRQRPLPIRRSQAPARRIENTAAIYIMGAGNAVATIVDIVSNRLWLREGLMHVFAGVWTDLLQSTLTGTAEAILRCEASGSLLGGVRRELTWMLEDFLKLVLKKLAHGFGLETLACLPTSQLTMAQVQSGEGSAAEKLALVTIMKVVGPQMAAMAQQLQSADLLTGNSSSLPMRAAPRTPLFSLQYSALSQLVTVAKLCATSGSLTAILSATDQLAVGNSASQQDKAGAFQFAQPLLSAANDESQSRVWFHDIIEHVLGLHAIAALPGAGVAAGTSQPIPAEEHATICEVLQRELNTRLQQEGLIDTHVGCTVLAPLILAPELRQFGLRLAAQLRASRGLVDDDDIKQAVHECHEHQGDTVRLLQQKLFALSIAQLTGIKLHSQEECVRWLSAVKQLRDGPMKSGAMAYDMVRTLFPSAVALVTIHELACAGVPVDSDLLHIATAEDGVSALGKLGQIMTVALRTQHSQQGDGLDVKSMKSGILSALVWMLSCPHATASEEELLAVLRAVLGVAPQDDGHHQGQSWFMLLGRDDALIPSARLALLRQLRLVTGWSEVLDTMLEKSIFPWMQKGEAIIPESVSMCLSSQCRSLLGLSAEYESAVAQFVPSARRTAVAVCLQDHIEQTAAALGGTPFEQCNQLLDCLEAAERSLMYTQPAAYALRVAAVGAVLAGVLGDELARDPTFQDLVQSRACAHFKQYNVSHPGWGALLLTHILRQEDGMFKLARVQAKSPALALLGMQAWSAQALGAGGEYEDRIPAACDALVNDGEYRDALVELHTVVGSKLHLASSALTRIQAGIQAYTLRVDGSILQAQLKTYLESIAGPSRYMDIVAAGANTGAGGAADAAEGADLPAPGAEVLLELLCTERAISLEYSRYIPDMLAVHHWIHAHLQGVFSEDEVYSLSMVQAIERAPLAQSVKAEGRQLLQAFIAAWRVLQGTFRQYVAVCGQQEAGENHIPPFVADAESGNGKSVVLQLHHMVDLPGSEADKSAAAPLRMLEDKLCKMQNGLLEMQPLRDWLDTNAEGDGTQLWRCMPPHETDASQLRGCQWDTHVLLQGAAELPRCGTAPSADDMFHVDWGLLALSAHVQAVHAYEDVPADTDAGEDSGAAVRNAMLQEAIEAGRAAQSEASQNEYSMCPQCKQIVSRTMHCDEAVCGQHSHETPGETAARLRQEQRTGTKLGCDVKFLFSANRVPALRSGELPLDVFLPAKYKELAARRQLETSRKQAAEAMQAKHKVPMAESSIVFDVAQMAHSIIPLLVSGRAVLRTRGLHHKLAVHPNTAALVEQSPAQASQPQTSIQSGAAGRTKAGSSLHRTDLLARLRSASGKLRSAIKDAGTTCKEVVPDKFAKRIKSMPSVALIEGILRLLQLALSEVLRTNVAKVTINKLVAKATSVKWPATIRILAKDDSLLVTFLPTMVDALQHSVAKSAAPDSSESLPGQIQDELDSNMDELHQAALSGYHKHVSSELTAVEGLCTAVDALMLDERSMRNSELHLAQAPSVKAWWAQQQTAQPDAAQMRVACTLLGQSMDGHKHAVQIQHMITLHEKLRHLQGELMNLSMVAARRDNEQAAMQQAASAGVTGEEDTEELTEQQSALLEEVSNPNLYKVKLPSKGDVATLCKYTPEAAPAHLEYLRERAAGAAMQGFVVPRDGLSPTAGVGQQLPASPPGTPFPSFGPPSSAGAAYGAQVSGVQSGVGGEEGAPNGFGFADSGMQRRSLADDLACIMSPSRSPRRPSAASEVSAASAAAGLDAATPPSESDQAVAEQVGIDEQAAADDDMPSSIHTEFVYSGIDLGASVKMFLLGQRTDATTGRKVKHGYTVVKKVVGSGHFESDADTVYRRLTTCLQISPDAFKGGSEAVVVYSGSEGWVLATPEALRNAQEQGGAMLGIREEEYEDEEPPQVQCTCCVLGEAVFQPSGSGSISRAQLAGPVPVMLPVDTPVTEVLHLLQNQLQLDDDGTSAVLVAAAEADAAAAGGVPGPWAPLDADTWAAMAAAVAAAVDPPQHTFALAVAPQLPCITVYYLGEETDDDDAFEANGDPTILRYAQVLGVKRDFQLVDGCLQDVTSLTAAVREQLGVPAGEGSLQCGLGDEWFDLAELSRGVCTGQHELAIQSR